MFCSFPPIIFFGEKGKKKKSRIISAINIAILNWLMPSENFSDKTANWTRMNVLIASVSFKRGMHNGILIR